MFLEHRVYCFNVFHLMYNKKYSIRAGDHSLVNPLSLRDFLHRRQNREQRVYLVAGHVAIQWYSGYVGLSIRKKIARRKPSTLSTLVLLVRSRLFGEPESTLLKANRYLLIDKPGTRQVRSSVPMTSWNSD